jgi:hypothetical protein
MRILTEVVRAKFVTDRMLYIILRAHWCDNISLNAQAQPQDKIDDRRDSI